jgi:hypothetical protein
VNWSDPAVKGRLKTAAIWAAVGIAYVLLGIDDWSRDWVRHEATLVFEPTGRHVARALAESPIHPDHVSLAEWSTAVQWAGKRIKNLEFEGEATDGDTAVLKFVRTHRLLRLKDDITVRITSDGHERTIETHAAARLHVGDLGRNPRTIRRLYAELEDVVAESNLVSAIGF